MERISSHNFYLVDNLNHSSRLIRKLIELRIYSRNKSLITITFLFIFVTTSFSQDWESNPSKTAQRPNAGLTGAEGATSGFFEAANFPLEGLTAINYPHNNPNRWHLLDIRHASPNNYAMQFAGEFWGPDLYFRKTADNASAAWSKVVLETDGIVNLKTPLNVGGDNFITIGDYTNTSGLKGIQFAGYRDVQANYFGASIEASPVWTCCSGYPNGGYAGIKEVDLNFNMSGKATAMKISYNGNIGIGNTSPLAKLDVSGNAYFRNTLYIGMPDASVTPAQISGYALAVNGTAIFNKAKVKLYGTWPDYVFQPNYKLLPLSELESFLVKNKHLPDVPSAVEVEKNGIDLGDNEAILLKKIEELTLYLIEHDKNMKELNKKVETLAKENERLTQKINSINR